MTRLPDWRRAERMAWRVLFARSITALPVEPLPILKACRDTCVMTSHEAADDLSLPQDQVDRLFDEADAITMRRQHQGSTQYLVIYRSGGNPARLRFTLAHELGHRLLGHTGEGAAEEREADHFASHLLCPEPVMSRLRSRFGDLPIRQTAVGCYVSPFCIRAVKQRPCAVNGTELYQQVDALLKDAADRLCDEIEKEKRK